MGRGLGGGGGEEGGLRLLGGALKCLGEDLGGEDLGGEDLGGENLGGRGEPLQHGPVQVFSFLRSLDDLRPEHLTWSHLKQMEHSTDTGESCLLQSAQNHLGPGFCSIPALISNSQIRQAGVVLFFVNHIKNTVQLRNVPHCRI